LVWLCHSGVVLPMNGMSNSWSKGKEGMLIYR
jgi:hypothetical protein